MINWLKKQRKLCDEATPGTWEEINVYTAEGLITSGYAEVADKAEFLCNKIKYQVNNELTLSVGSQVFNAYLQLEHALKKVNQKVSTNIANYLDLKDENRRLNDIVDMHEQTQDRMLSDLARYEDERKKLRKVAEAASKVQHYDCSVAGAENCSICAALKALQDKVGGDGE